MKKEIQKILSSIIVDQEYTTAKSNKDIDNNDFEHYVDLFDSERPEKDYDWMSDISLPEFFTHMVTQSAMDVGQYFTTRDFVEAYLEESGEQAKAHAGAAKECINRTLNQKHLHHYQKYVRGKSINHLFGSVWLECWWEQETRRGVVGKKHELVDMSVPDGESLSIKMKEVDVEGDIVVKDRFNYDVVDPRNVFTDNSYVYDIQDKPFVIIRRERTLSELKAEKDRHGYFNLDKLKENADGDTETDRETTNSTDSQERTSLAGNEPVDVLTRYGKFWCEVLERKNGIPVKVSPGLDEDGEPTETAELVETVITFALTGSSKYLIGFNVTPYVDADNNLYRPLIRGICYIHPTRDNGAGDGKANSEIQTAIDDTFNMSNDRVRLGTIPVFKGKMYATDDVDSFYIEPGHRIPVEDPNDLQELQISSDIGGSLQQLATLTGNMDKAMAIYPSTMGSLPVHSSTSATAIAGADSRTDMRTNYKAMTFEYTALTKLYWMIQQMTYRFAKEETALKLMGEKVYDFDPTKDYYYKPVSATIESEQSKDIKIQRLTQLIGYTSNLQHPDTVRIINRLMAKIYDLWGDEVADYGETLLDEEVPVGQGDMIQAEGSGTPVSNQNGVMQSIAEQSTRGI